jgi:hypothetical protein
MVRVNVVSNESEVKRPHQGNNERPMRRSLLVVALALVASFGGCVDVACVPITVVVAAKDERPQLRSEPRGLGTDELGRVKEQRREVIVSEYWVRDREGRWYRVGEAQWRAVEPGQPTQVCR